MNRTSPIVTALTLILAPVAVGQGPNVPTTRLGTPEAEFPESFSQIVGFRALSDGRFLVTDQVEQLIALGNFSTGSYDEVGRPGEGPGAFQMPGPLCALPGDTTLMMDGVGSRMDVITPDGHIADNTIPLRHPDGFPILPRAVDRQGRVYFDLAGFMMPGLEEMGAKGEAPLFRWDRNRNATDTLGYVRFPPMPPVGRGEMRVSIGGGAYQGRDAWAVTPDGRVGIVRFSDYHVDWLQPGRPTVSGPPVPYRPVPIGRAEKEAWADLLATRGIMVSIENGRRRVGRPPRPDIDNMTFPDVMPPFPANNGVFASPDGSLWVERSRPASAKQRTYDVFDASGNRVRQVVFPENCRLLGFGDGVLFAIRTDNDDLEWVQRYRM